MVLSPAERSYIYSSLSSSEVTRTDSRKPNQFRPLRAVCSFLPNSNGSSRIFTSDGLECITSVKAKVTKFESLVELVTVEVNISQQRDDSSLCLNLSSLLSKALLSSINLQTLKLTDTYAFQLSIDIVVLSIPQDFNSSSYTLYSLLSLASFGMFIALKSTRLPLLISNTNNKDVEEEPTFADDWESSIPLFSEDSKLNPTVLFIVSVVGNNVFIDPSLEEEQVSEHALCVGYNNGKIVAPIQSVTLSTSDGKAISVNIMKRAFELVKEIGGPVTQALTNISKEELDDFDVAF
ncbi:unnamed protein product [[Candida] boidinii]|uniref:Ribosomal RNA-processing protein 42 n=1 Tax=Candida boidinii TaxID=5477 RepID=A0A9W6T3I7_CANBO|nr:hypothetical protein BVG19_g4795 [[Candida] boidinii]OWB51948.1 hypothetical protein B5S27_g3519 [[Candida] boidinii]OWB70114.1 hypothetical protein B5S30_g5572 [[Candida] boidinii]GME76563.1 unnamed protein product [[Candida] boidinii]GMG15677.1 unnamed protein product [[Candida] boidinii]